MKTVILAGGFGTRLSEETDLVPKPMLPVGGRPILWHIMKIYSSHGFNDFVICLGYKGYSIKEYFAHYFLHESDVTFDFTQGTDQCTVHRRQAEPWRVTLVDTGLNSMTGGRIKRVRDYVDDGTFMLTYGDGVGDVDINSLVEFHKSHGKLATVTAVQPSGRFGAMSFGPGDAITSFKEKPSGDGGWINGGFFVLEPKVLDYIAGDDTTWEQEPLNDLVRDGQLAAFRHRGFWKPMDTLRDKRELNALWEGGKAPWKTWS